MAKNEIVKTEKDKILAVVHDYGDDAGSGYENMSPEDMVIPWWNLLQSNSPAVEQETPAGAAAGLYLNSVTNELVKKEIGVPVVPVYTEKAYVKWDPAKRITGGGFMGVFDPDDDVVKSAKSRYEEARKVDVKTARMRTDDDMDLVETHYLYCLDIDEESFGSGDEFADPKGFSVFSFKSTGIRPFQTALSATRMVKGRPPLWAFRWRIGSEKRTNEKGTFAVPKIWPAVGANYLQSLIPPQSALFEAAKTYRDQVMRGVARVDHSAQESASVGESPTRRTAADIDADDAPF